ncbi:TonB-dependent receptor [Roseivirga pacifica]
MRLLNPLFFSLLLISAFSLNAQKYCTYNVSGVVKSSEDGSTLPLATLEFVINEKSAITDVEGKFEMKELCQSNIQIRIRYVGFETLIKDYTLKTGNNELEILLDPSSQSLDEVTIEGEKAEEIASLQLSKIGAEEINKAPAKSLGEVLSEFTGVNVLQTGPTIAKPVIHGLHSNRILILNNGIRQEGQQWGQEHAPEIDPFVANNLELIKGAAAVKYGADAIGGVILVNPDDLPSEAGISGKASLIGASNNGLYSGSGLLEGGFKGIDGLGWRVQGTYKRAGDAKAADYRLTNTGMKELNYSVGLGYHKADGGAELFYSSFSAEYGILRSAHIGNLTDLENAIGSDRPLFIEDFSYDINNPYQDVKHQLLKANAHKTVEGLGEFNVQYGFQHNNRKEFDVRRGGRSETPSLSLDLYTHTVELDLNFTAGEYWRGDAGFSFMYQNNENNPETGIRPLIPDFENWTGGAHGIMRYVRDKYELEAGVRYDMKHYLVKRFDQNNQLQKPEFDFNNVTGSIGGLFYLQNSWMFRTNVGTAWRAPHVNELYSEGLHHGAAAIEEGNDQLVSEKAVKWINTLSKQTTKWRMEFTAYYNLINDYIYLRPEDVALTIRGAFPVLRYQQTDASFIGFDTDFEYQVANPSTISAKLSYIRAEDLNTNAPLINIPASQAQLGYEHKFASQKLVEPFVRLDMIGVARQWNDPRVVTIAEIREADQNDEDLFATDGSIFDIMEVPDGYVNFNISAGFGIPTKSGNPIDVFLSVENALNNSYRNYLNRFRYYADDIGRNVSLRINYSF